MTTRYANVSLFFPDRKSLKSLRSSGRKKLLRVFQYCRKLFLVSGTNILVIFQSSRRSEYPSTRTGLTVSHAADSDAIA
jgi:hypothetical protein